MLISTFVDISLKIKLFFNANSYPSFFDTCLLFSLSFLLPSHNILNDFYKMFNKNDNTTLFLLLKEHKLDHIIFYFLNKMEVYTIPNTEISIEFEYINFKNTPLCKKIGNINLLNINKKFKKKDGQNI